MSTRDILRIHGQDERDKEARKAVAVREYKELKASIIREYKQTEIEKELPELDGLVTKQHLRHARRIMSSGRRIGPTVDRLPIHTGSKTYHQANYRAPKDFEFEGPILALVEKYGPTDAAMHFSFGQIRKYNQQVNPKTEVIEFWNVITGEREYPVMSLAEKLVFRIAHETRETDSS